MYLVTVHHSRLFLSIILTVLSLLPHDALQVDAGAWLTGSQALRLGRQRSVRRVNCYWTRAHHDLLTGRRDVTAGDGSEEVEGRRSRGGDRRLHLLERDREERLSDLGTLRGRQLWTREQNAQQPGRRRTRLLSLSYTPETFIHLIHSHSFIWYAVIHSFVWFSVLESEVLLFRPSGQQKQKTKILSPHKARPA